jgi:type IV pilus assembly protein PilB
MNIKIGQLLLNSGIISNRQLEEALSRQSEDNNRLGYHLVQIQAISEADLNKFLERQQSIESSNLDKVDIEEDVINLITGDIARRYEVIPISREGRKLIVAMTDPNNLFAIDDLRFSLGMDIEPHICASSMIKRALSKFYAESEAIVPIDESNKKKGNSIHTSLADIDDEGIATDTDMLIGDEVFESMIIQ